MAVPLEFHDSVRAARGALWLDQYALGLFDQVMHAGFGVGDWPTSPDALTVHVCLLTIVIDADPTGDLMRVGEPSHDACGAIGDSCVVPPGGGCRVVWLDVFGGG